MLRRKTDSSLSSFSCRSRFVARKRRLLYLSIYTVTPEKTMSKLGMTELPLGNVNFN